jgi:hypothetical protein
MLNYNPMSLCRLLLQHFNIFLRISSIYNINHKWPPFWKYPWKLPPYVANYRPGNDYGAPHEWTQLTFTTGKVVPLRISLTVYFYCLPPLQVYTNCALLNKREDNTYIYIYLFIYLLPKSSWMNVILYNKKTQTAPLTNTDIIFLLLATSTNQQILRSPQQSRR